jgi:hypothetical protein
MLDLNEIWSVDQKNNVKVLLYIFIWTLTFLVRGRNKKIINSGWFKRILKIVVPTLERLTISKETRLWESIIAID